MVRRQSAEKLFNSISHVLIIKIGSMSPQYNQFYMQTTNIMYQVLFSAFHCFKRQSTDKLTLNSLCPMVTLKISIK